MEFEYLH